MASYRQAQGQAARILPAVRVQVWLPLPELDALAEAHAGDRERPFEWSKLVVGADCTGTFALTYVYRQLPPPAALRQTRRQRARSPPDVYIHSVTRYEGTGLLPQLHP